MGRSTRFDRPILAVVLATIMVLSVFAPIGVVGADTQPSDRMDVDSVEYSDRSIDAEPATIDEELSDAEGTVTAILQLEDVDETFLADSDDPARTLQTYAETAQDPIEQYADSTEGVEIKRGFWITNAVLVSVDTARVSFDELAHLEGVTEIHPNREFEFLETTTERNTSSSDTEPMSPSLTADGEEYTYGLEQLNVPAVWEEYDTRGDGSYVAVLDSGIDVDSHDDLELTENGWVDFDENGEERGTEPWDDNGHGTHVSGTVAGDQIEGTGSHYGVAPDVELMHANVDDGDGNPTTAATIAGIEWAAEHEHDVDVITMSLGGYGYEDAYIDPIRNAEELGITVIAAAGNGGNETSISPANVYDTLAIGASNESAGIADFSSGDVIDTKAAWGDAAPADWEDEYIVPDVAAPGVNVCSTVPGGEYDCTYSGTSMAAPHMAGVVALMQSTGDAQPEEIKAALTENAWKPDGESTEQDTRYGHGIIDAKAATDYAMLDSGVEGTVTDGEGEPIPDVTISAGEWSTLTESDGTYQVKAEAGEHTVTADSSEYRTASKGVTVEQDEYATANFSLEQNLTASFYGTADVVGSPAPEGHNVTASIDGELSATTEIGPNGQYATSDDPLTLNGTTANENATITFSVEDMQADQTVTWEGDISKERNLTVPGGTLEGNVTEETSEKTIESASVELEDGDGNHVTETSTDEVGAYEFEGLTSDEYAITVIADGFDTTERSEITVSAGADVEPTTENVELYGNAMVEGTITDESTGEPLPNATIAVTGPYGPFEETTDDSGIYSVDHVPGVDEEYTIEAEADNYLSMSDSPVIESNATETVDISLESMDLDIALEGPAEPVMTGDDAEFTANVTNNASETVTETVSLEVGGEIEDKEEITLESGNSTNVPLSWQTNNGDGGIHDVNATVGDSMATTTIEVGYLEVTIANITEHSDDENALNITTDIENTGEVETEQQVTLDGGSLGADETNVSLQGGELVEETFTLELTGDEDGTYTVVVSSDDDTDSTELEFGDGDDGEFFPPPSDDGAIFELGEIDVPDEMDTDSTAELAVPVQNVGTDSGSTAVGLSFAGEVATTSIGLEAGSEETLGLPIYAPSESGTYDLVVDTEDDQYVTTVAVIDPESDDESTQDDESATDEEETDDSTDDADTDDEDDDIAFEFADGQPGFGVPAAIVALLVGLFVARVHS